MPPDPHSTSVTIHTSLRGLLTAALSPLLLIGLGVWGMVLGGARPVPVLLIVLGGALAGVVAFDYPASTHLDSDGIHRRCLLRTQHLPWEQIVAIERSRRATADGLRTRVPARFAGAETAERTARGAARGGLVARGTRQRRWLLTDRMESRGEFDRVRKIIAAATSGRPVRAMTPPDSVPPTGLYRRSTRG